MSAYFIGQVLASDVIRSVAKIMGIKSDRMNGIGDVADPKEILRMTKTKLQMLSEAEQRDVICYLVDAFEELEDMILREHVSDVITAEREQELSKYRKEIGIDRMALDIRMPIRRCYYYKGGMKR